jgi:hypothetical protein
MDILFLSRKFKTPSNFLLWVSLASFRRCLGESRVESQTLIHSEDDWRDTTASTTGTPNQTRFPNGAPCECGSQAGPIDVWHVSSAHTISLASSHFRLLCVDKRLRWMCLKWLVFDVCHDYQLGGVKDFLGLKFLQTN